MEGLHGVRIRLCPTLVVEAPGGALSGRALGSRKARTLLALLAAERGGPVPLDRVVAVLWGEHPPADPAANVATLASRTRRVVGRGLIGGSGAYALTPGGPWTLDLDEATRLARTAAVRAAAGEHLLAVASARGALELLGEATLVDEADADWVQAVRREADGLRRAAAHHLAGSLSVLDPAEAVPVARAAVARDGYDERAVRDLMRALVADGRPAAALTAYAELARRLRDDLGTAPDRTSADLHLAVLRETDPPDEPEAAILTGVRPGVRPGVRRTGERTRGGRPAGCAGLVGREAELALVERSWASAGRAGEPLLLVVGAAGIGKTRLLDAVAELASSTGGLALRGRCHPAERSLFLQPYVDALRPCLLRMPGPALADLVRDHAAAWVSLLPDLGEVVPDPAGPPADPGLQRRQAFDAVGVALTRLAVTRPVLLTLDDLQDAGAATVDLLGYLARRLRGARVLVVAALRSEAAPAVDRLADRSVRLDLHPLDRAAVDALAADAGVAGLGEQVMARTAGHPLSVVEYIRALAAGRGGVPASLADAVLTRVGRLEAGTRAVVEAAAVVRRRLDPRLVGALVGAAEVATVHRCEELTRRGLLVRSGGHYEFANDLLQECVYAALPPALTAAHHRRLAELTGDRPEVMAEHAAAAGDPARAAHGWLLAGEEALRRAALDDARELLARSLGVSAATSDTRARALLVRGRVHEARMQWDEALADVDAALALTRRSGDRRLEMSALRARGGDAAVGARRSHDDLVEPLEAGLALAAGLGDRRTEADFAGRLTVLEASRLCLASALARADRALARARAAGAEEAVLLALDGVKTVWWYLGAPDRLAEVVAELGPLVRAREHTWLLQWVVFESAFVPAARGDWAQAAALLAEAGEINDRSGFTAYAGFLRAYEGWFARLAGDLDRARRLGRRAVDLTSSIDHPWWYAGAAGLLAATLAETGERAEAEAVARAGLAAGRATAPAVRLPCLAALAALTGAPDDLARATALLDAVQCPPGHAWVLGADAYLLLAAAAAERGDPGEAARLLAPLRAATTDTWPALRRRVDRLP